MENLINDTLNTIIANCQNDSAYNDNTLYDILRYGFKGLENMSQEELQAEFDRAKSWMEGN